MYWRSRFLERFRFQFSGHPLIRIATLLIVSICDQGRDPAFFYPRDTYSAPCPIRVATLFNFGIIGALCGRGRDLIFFGFRLRSTRPGSRPCSRRSPKRSGSRPWARLRVISLSDQGRDPNRGTATKTSYTRSGPKRVETKGIYVLE